MSGFGSPWRNRLGLLMTLLLLIAVNGGILIVYRVFYDIRLDALLTSQVELERKRDEVARSLERLRAREQKLGNLQGALEVFFTETLGTRQERLAPLIEDIYKMTSQAGLKPGSINYSESEVPGAHQILMNFSVQGRYADIKKLLYILETSPRFLVVENVAVSLSGDQPDLLNVALSVTHFFREEAPSTPKKKARPAGNVAKVAR
jgi:Tfp pilus assembly protein PilO